MHIPGPDLIAAALEAQPSYLTPVGWSHISNDTPYDDVLDGLAVRTGHGCYLLSE